MPESCCSYCGDFNECQDHVIPVSYNSGNRKTDQGETVDCCMECNRLAGDFVAFSINEKAAHLEVRYQFKYEKLLSRSVWTETEMLLMDYTFQERLKRQEFTRALVQMKMNNLGLVATGHKPVPIRNLSAAFEAPLIEDRLEGPARELEGPALALFSPFNGRIAEEKKMPANAPHCKVPLPPKPCINCSTTFTPYRSWQEFCSPKCRKDHYWKTHEIKKIPSNPLATNRPDENDNGAAVLENKTDTDQKQNQNHE